MATAYPLDLAGSAAFSASQAGRGVASENLPGYMTSMGNIGANIASKTAGQVPEDVKRQFFQENAEQSGVTGAASNAAYLARLGKTSLGLQSEGQKELESILGVTPGFPMSQNPEFQTSASLSYEQRIQQEIFSRQQQQQQFELQQQRLALQAAKEGLGRGGGAISWAAPTNAWSGGGYGGGYGSPGFTTADLPGQTSSAGYTKPYAPGPMIAYGPGGGPGAATYADLYGGAGSNPGAAGLSTGNFFTGDEGYYSDLY